MRLKRRAREFFIVTAQRDEHNTHRTAATTHSTQRATHRMNERSRRLINSHSYDYLLQENLFHFHRRHANTDTHCTRWFTNSHFLYLWCSSLIEKWITISCCFHCFYLVTKVFIVVVVVVCITFALPTCVSGCWEIVKRLHYTECQPQCQAEWRRARTNTDANTQTSDENGAGPSVPSLIHSTTLRRNRDASSMQAFITVSYGVRFFAENCWPTTVTECLWVFVFLSAAKTKKKYF